MRSMCTARLAAIGGCLAAGMLTAAPAASAAEPGRANAGGRPPYDGGWGGTPAVATSGALFLAAAAGGALALRRRQGRTGT